ncbi:MAG: DUF554 domain-containing protein [Clostridiales bacterium]|nr:DUF554 domain-containing protein [Clostridiales bacterium]
MIGTLINVVAVVAGTLLGLLFGKKITEEMRRVLTLGVGMCVVVLGLQSALATSNMMLVIIAVVLGGVAGSLLKIEKGLDRMGDMLQKRFARGGSRVGEGFVTATLIFCVGAMAITGALDSGLRGDHSTLVAKSVLDGVTSMVLASTMGWGVMLSAVAVLIYQGGIALAASFVAPLLENARMVTEMSAVGGVLIMGIGLNMIGMKERIPVGDLLPAIVMPAFLVLIM